jgi:hypothetical protein
VVRWILVAFLGLAGCAKLLGIDDLQVVDGDAAPGCTANQNFCDGDQVYACYANGTRGDLLADCALGLCAEGACIDSCAAAAAHGVYIGCEYWAADLSNAIEVLGAAADCNTFTQGATPYTGELCWTGSATNGACAPDRSCPSGSTCQLPPATAHICALDAQHSRFGLVVANPSPSLSAEVTIEDATGMSVVRTVAAQDTLTLFPAELGFVDHSLALASTSLDAYRVTSSRPITIYQFNPLVVNGAFSADASLLYPAHGLATRYVADMQPAIPAQPGVLSGGYAYVTLVGTGASATTVDVTPTAALSPGVTMPARAAGQTFQVTLAPYQTVTLASQGDVSGTTMTATAGTPFAAFVGTDLSQIRGLRTDTCCADHLEEQLLPPAVLDVEYAVAISPTDPRATDGGNRLHLVAEAAASVTFDPPVAAGSCAQLTARVPCDVLVTQDTLVHASGPITIGQTLIAGAQPGVMPAPDGDPSISWAVPTSRYRPTALVEVPTGFTSAWLLVTTPAGVTPRLDGIAQGAAFAQVGHSTYRAGRLPVTPGRHAIDCRPGACGVTMMGVAPYVSYMMPAGIDFPR